MASLSIDGPDLEVRKSRVALVDRIGSCVCQNKWSKDHPDREIVYVGDEIRNCHCRALVNPCFRAMLKPFEECHVEPVTYVACLYGKTTILITVSPIYVDGNDGYSQIVLLNEEVETVIQRFNTLGRGSLELTTPAGSKPMNHDQSTGKT